MDWWFQQEVMHTRYADLSNVARDIFAIILHGVGVEACFSHGWNVVRWRQSTTTSETLREKIVVRQFAGAKHRLLAGNDPAFNTPSTKNNMEINRQAEQRKLQRMAKVHYLLEISQGSQNLRTRQRESRAAILPMTAVQYISNTEEIVQASWSNFQHDGVAAFKLLERSPVPPA